MVLQLVVGITQFNAEFLVAAQKNIGQHAKYDDYEYGCCQFHAVLVLLLAFNVLLLLQIGNRVLQLAIQQLLVAVGQPIVFGIYLRQLFKAFRLVEQNRTGSSFVMARKCAIKWKVIIFLKPIRLLLQIILGKFTNNIYERQVSDKKSAYYFCFCRKYTECRSSFVLFSISIDGIISCLIR